MCKTNKVSKKIYIYAFEFVLLIFLFRSSFSRSRYSFCICALVLLVDFFFVSTFFELKLIRILLILNIKYVKEMK